MTSSDTAAPTPKRPRVRLPWLVVGLLGVTTIVASTGWFLAAHEGRGIAPQCYSLDDSSREIRFSPLHGNYTLKATFAVAESKEQVMLGYWEESEDGIHTMEGYGSNLTYTLIRPLEGRQVVDPSGEPVPRC